MRVFLSSDPPPALCDCDFVVFVTRFSRVVLWNTEEKRAVHTFVNTEQENWRHLKVRELPLARPCVSRGTYVRGSSRFLPLAAPFRLAPLERKNHLRKTPQTFVSVVFEAAAVFVC